MYIYIYIYIYIFRFSGVRSFAAQLPPARLEDRPGRILAEEPRGLVAKIILHK